MKFPFNSKGMIIGITGSTGSGKSVVSSFLKENGYKVIDFNQIIKETSQLNHIQKELINHFGTGDLDKIKQDLNPKTHFFLNQIISVPAMKETFRQTHEAFEKGEAIVFWEASLLIETNSFQNLHGLILTVSDEEKRTKRILNRDNVSLEYIQNVFKNQLSDKDKIEKITIHPKTIILENNDLFSKFKIKLLDLLPWLDQFK